MNSVVDVQLREPMVNVNSWPRRVTALGRNGPGFPGSVVEDVAAAVENTSSSREVTARSAAAFVTIITSSPGSMVRERT